MLCLELPRGLSLHVRDLASRLLHTQTEKLFVHSEEPTISCPHRGTPPPISCGGTLLHLPQQLTGLLPVWVGCLLITQPCPLLVCLPSWLMPASMWRESPVFSQCNPSCSTFASKLTPPPGQPCCSLSSRDPSVSKLLRDHCCSL